MSDETPIETEEAPEYQPVKRLRAFWQHEKGRWSEFSMYLYVPEEELEAFRALRKAHNLSEIYNRFAISKRLPDEKKSWVWEDPEMEAKKSPGGGSPEEFHREMSRKYGSIKELEMKDVVQTVQGARPIDPSDGV